MIRTAGASMDPVEVAEKLANGSVVTVLAFAVVALSIVAIVLFRRINQLHDQRVQDMREMGAEARKLLEQTNLALGALAEPVREAVREMRGRK